jgi:hypothetical protein
MGIARGPNVVNDNLILGYDSGYGVANTAVPTRFYKGKPTVNMLTNGDNFANWNKTFNSAPHVTITSDVAPGPFNGTLADKMSIPTGGAYPRIFQVYTPASTATHTFSVWLKAETPGQSVFVGAFRNSPWSLPASTAFTITSEWVNYSLAINPQDTTSMQIYIGSHDGHKGKEFLIYGAQLEASSDKSPFVDGTRSDTASLIDLKRTTNIDTTNISFDSSTGQPHFDGSDDFIDLANNPHNGATQASWEFVVKFHQTHDDDTGTYRQLYIQEGSVWIAQYLDKIGIDLMANGMSSWFDGNGGVNTGSQTAVVDANIWYHVVFTFNNGVIKGYLNNVLQFTTTVSSGMTTGIINGSTPRRIGRRTNQPLDGDMPVVRLYDTDLSALQVETNFKAYKNRFNI